MKKKLIKTVVIGAILAVTFAGGFPVNAYAWNQDEMIAILKQKMIEDGLNPDDARSTGGTAKSKAAQQMQGNQSTLGEASDNATTTSANEKVVEPQHSHKYTSKVLKNPTCTEEGEIQYTCECGDTYIEKTAKREHEYEVEVTKEATCEEAGEKTSICSVCGATITEEIPALGHEEGLWGVTKESACTVEGERSLYCKNGGEVLRTEVIEATGHTLGEWKVEKESTMFQKGQNILRCSVCNVILEAKELPITMTGWYVVIGGAVLAGGAVFLIIKAIRRKK